MLLIRPMRESPTIPTPTPRTRWGWLLAFAAGVALLLGLMISLPELRRAPVVPSIVTDRLDPAVKALVEGTLTETRLAPRSGTAWGKLGRVLMHYEFVDEARVAFEHAERLEPNEPRWP